MGFLTSIIGGIGSIVGGNKEKKAANQGFDWAKGSQLNNYLGTGADANSTMAAALGLGGDPAAATGAFNNYLGSTGYNFDLDSGSRAITGSAAARGLLGSGATSKALTKFGTNLGQQYFQNWLGNLSGLSTSGLNAGGMIANAGSAAAPNVAKAEQDKWGGLTSSVSNGLSSVAGFFK